MGDALSKLTGLIGAADAYDLPAEQLQSAQVAAAQELFQARVGQIKLLKHRAAEGAVTQIRSREDLVPLLFAHTAYKSYPESWFTQGRWDRMNRWLDTLTSSRVPEVDLSKVADVDDWIDRMAETGHFLSCSSGTTGKCSIIPADQTDRERGPKAVNAAMSWATGIEPRPQFVGFILSPLNRNWRMMEGFADTARTYTTSTRDFPVPPIRVADVTGMVGLRRRMAEGVAMPAEVETFEKTAQARAQAMESAYQTTAEAIVAKRAEPIFLRGFLGPIWEITQRVRAMGYGRNDFNPQNLLLTAGGTKGAAVPPDVREQVFDTFNINPPRAYQFYSMQELGSPMPKCQAGRYHVPPWLMLLVLDDPGEALAKPSDGEVEGRAGFFDTSLSGRWGGLISGDKITARLGRCDCGHAGPTVGDKIERYADIAGGDKITCAGTIDAYVRGAA